MNVDLTKRLVDSDGLLSRLRLEWPLYIWSMGVETLPENVVSLEDPDPNKEWLTISYTDPATGKGNGVFFSKVKDTFTELDVRNILNMFKISVENYKAHLRAQQG